MTQWATGKWADKWGCSLETLEQFSLLSICDRYIWWQHRDHPNLQRLCLIYVVLFSRLDIKLQLVVTNRGIDGASGGEVDNWGAMVGQPRNGASDQLYKATIKAKARAMIGSGNISDFFDTAILISPESDPKFAEAYPACVRMFFSSAISNEEKEIILDLMKQVPGLGICLSFVEVDPDGVFEFSYLNDELDPTSLDPVEFHWGHTDGDIADTAGFAYLIE